MAQGTRNVRASGDQRIDGLLAGVAWAGPISYADPDSRSDYPAGHPESFHGFRQLDARQLLATHGFLSDDARGQPPGARGFSVEAVCGLEIGYAGSSSGAADVLIANTSDPGTAYTYGLGSGAAGGDVFLGSAGAAPVAGNYHWFTLVHELGHALGLKHGNERDGLGALPAATDSMEYSVMTYRSYVGADGRYVYNETWGYAQTLMMDDIAALQYLYGADFGANSGNTVYAWNPGTGATTVNGQPAISPGANRVFLTIWDGGGTDTYDASAYGDDVVIDLRPGGASTLAAAQLARLGPGEEARGNVFNARQFQGDARSLIENATGGTGDDTITGNVARNVLRGGDGGDVLRGLGGNDHLIGGRQSDTLNGGAGADILDGGAGWDTFVFDGTSGSARDVIRGFINAGDALGDWIDLSAVDANLDRGGHQDFVLGGTAVGHLWLAESGGSTLVRGNTRGNAAPELQFAIEDGATRAAAYTEADFIGIA